MINLLMVGRALCYLNNNNNNRRLVTLAEHTSDHGTVLFMSMLLLMQ